MTEPTAVHDCRFSWGELLADGEPYALTGVCEGFVADASETPISFPVSGAPEMFDAQLDAALGRLGWRRVSDVTSWPGRAGGEGRCKVQRRNVPSVGSSQGPEPTAEDLAVTLAALDEQAKAHPHDDGPWNYWSTGYVIVHGKRFDIDVLGSDALAARLGHPGRNESEGRWIVVVGMEVEHVDGLGWRPVAR